MIGGGEYEEGKRKQEGVSSTGRDFMRVQRLKFARQI